MNYFLIILGCCVAFSFIYLLSTKIQINSRIYKLHEGDNEAKLVREILTKVRFISVITVVYIISSFLFFSYLLNKLN